MRSFIHAFRGLGTLVTTQRNARVHVVATLLAVALGLGVGLSRLEWCAIALSIGFVVAAEALNTGVEFVCDALHPEHHPMIGKAKDVAAAGVLIAATSAAVVGALLFMPRLLP